MRVPDVLPPWVARAWWTPEACEIATFAVPGALRRAVPTRQREFVAGRRCAAAAMARLGQTSNGLPIGTNGAPVWPGGVVGSITHTDRIVCAAAALAGDAAGLGIDIEPVLSPDRLAHVERRVATRAEIAGLAAQTRLDRVTVLTLAFSAKEAVYKCLYPQVGRVFDYLDAEVDDVDTAARSMSVRLVTGLSAEWPKGARIRGRFDIDSDLVWTGFVLPPDAKCS
jgi:enterobactin synthetase component D